MSAAQQALTAVHGFVNSALMRIGLFFTPLPASGSRVAPVPVPAPEHEVNPFSHRPRVLVVDDNEANRLLLQALLGRWSISPLEAADGAEGVALACGQHFDLILMDVQMPILDGLTATAQIRGFERRNEHPRAPIVAYTSSLVGDDWPILRACGFDESLDKPCTRQSLEACLRRWCASRSAHAVSPMPAH